MVKKKIHPKLGELKYDSVPSNPYYAWLILFFLLLVIYSYMELDNVNKAVLPGMIVFILVILLSVFLSLAAHRDAGRLRIYSKGIIINVIRYEGNPHKGLKGWWKGRKKVKYEDIVSIHPFSQVPLFTSGKRKGLTFMLPGGKKGKLAGQFGLKGERSKEAIQIIKEQMGDLWIKKFRKSMIVSVK